MIDSNYFKKEIIEKKQSAFIAFIASWCTPSQLEKQVFDELHEEYKDRIIIDCVDIDSEEELAREFDIKNLPSVLCIDEGCLVETICCFQSKKDFVDGIEYYLEERSRAKACENSEKSVVSTLKGVFARLKEAFRFH